MNQKMSAFNDYNDKCCDKRADHPKKAIASPVKSGAGDNNTPEVSAQTLDSITSLPVVNSFPSLMPVSELQELCAKSGFQNPEYRLVKTEGSSHLPLFTIKVFLKDVELGEGIAKSKKAAKHSAAQKALIAIKEKQLLNTSPKSIDPLLDLNKLRINDSDNCDSSSSGVESQLVSSDGQTSESSSAFTQRNGVSILQELCAKNGFELPEYILSDQFGSCHEPIFNYTCNIMVGIEKISGKASGKTKQMAKRAAAEEVLKIIQEKEIPLYSSNGIKKKTRNNSHNNNLNYEQLKSYKETLDLMESLQTRHDLDHLIDSNHNDIDCCNRFNIIAENLNCFANYIPFTEENSKTNKFKCLLQMRRNQSQSLAKRLPVFVSWGNSPVSIEQAMQKAAQKAIIMVRVLKM